MVPEKLKGGRTLRALHGEFRSQSLPQPNHFQKISAVVGP